MKGKLKRAGWDDHFLVHAPRRNRAPHPNAIALGGPRWALAVTGLLCSSRIAIFLAAALAEQPDITLDALSRRLAAARSVRAECPRC